MGNNHYEIRKLMHTYLNLQSALNSGIEEAEQNKDVDAHLCAKAMKKQCRIMISKLWKTMVEIGALDDEEIEMGGIRGNSLAIGERE